MAQDTVNLGSNDLETLENAQRLLGRLAMRLPLGHPDKLTAAGIIQRLDNLLARADVG